jgi:hypothetical protein
MTGRAGQLHEMVTALEEAGIPFMIVGSVASGYHGEPRASYDVDIVVDANAEQVKLLAELVQPRHYIAIDAALQAAAQRSAFAVVDLTTGLKTDLIFRKDRPFSIAEFERRQPALIAGVPAFVVSVEDCILSKLERSKQLGSERHYQDAVKVALVAGADLDRAYLGKWAEALGVQELFARLSEEIDPPLAEAPPATS